jgi:hypothetical protein
MVWSGLVWFGLVWSHLVRLRDAVEQLRAQTGVRNGRRGQG